MHKVKIKVGPYEFEAEGDKEAVEAQLAQFMELINKAPATAPLKLPAAATQKPEHPEVDPEIHQDPKLADAVILCFRDENGLISLNMLPKTKAFAADSLLLLLYGYRVLKHQNQVLGGHLLKAGKQSGLQIDRVDRVLEAHGEFILKGGARKGARYTLNNRGIEKAKDILMKMHD